MSVKNPNDTIARLRSLQSALREDWEAVRENTWTLQAMSELSLADDIRAAAAATYVLRAYSAIEQLLLRIAEAFNGGVPESSAWHRELIALMARDVLDSRPAVISKELRDELDEYRKFRHRVTHAYGVRLAWEKMQHLVQRLPTMVDELDSCLQTFYSFVDQLCTEIHDS